MTLAGADSKRVPGARRALTLGLVLAGLLAMIGSGAATAWAGPAQEEYRLQLPDARGGGDSSGPGEARSILSQGQPPSPGSSTNFGTGGPTTGGPAGPSGGNGGNGGVVQPGDRSDEALLAKARDGVPGSGLLSASTSAAGKTPVGLAVLGALLLITVAGVLAARRRRRAQVGLPD